MLRAVNILFYVLFGIFSVVFIAYLLLPGSGIPPQLPRSLGSPEPADKAFWFRPAYFTYSNRAETMAHYQEHFSYSPFQNIYIPTYRLNYPPEDSSFLVRAHVYSSYLEEIVHPFRESLYINGFRPSRPQDDIWIWGVHYDEKIIVKFVPSPFIARVALGVLALITLFVLTRQFAQSVKILVWK